MKKRWLVLTGAGLAIALAGLASTVMIGLFRKSEPEWTTRSHAARREFEQGLEELTRAYYSDAREHLERAVELDPKFVAARVHLSWLLPHSSPEFEQHVVELRQADTGRLNPRERFLLAYWLAFVDQERDEARAVLRDFLAEFPTDLFGLQEECDRLWWERDMESAETCYNRMIKLHPNWVRAYERLGFIAMARGRFSAAEEHFQAYRFIAPDQAAPHTSLAELQILLGRYEEAVESLEEALAVKDDFCPAHQHLFRAFALSGRLVEASAALDLLQAVPGCADLREKGFFCHGRAFVAFLAGDLEAAWSAFSGDCLERRGGFDIIAHDVAVASGRLAEAAEMEERLRRRFEAVEGGFAAEIDWYESALAHAEGVRLMAAGDYAAASTRLSEADERLQYWTPDLGSFKLFNRALLVHALERSGRTSQARAVLKKIEAVNPRFAPGLHETGIFPEPVP